jgi:hypothetical protein
MAERDEVCGALGSLDAGEVLSLNDGLLGYCSCGILFDLLEAVG